MKILVDMNLSPEWLKDRLDASTKKETMPAEFRYDVFLSHNAADKPRVRKLAERLRAAGLKPKAECRMQNAELLPSASFILPSPLVGLERSTVLFRDPANAGRRFIPRLRGTA